MKNQAKTTVSSLTAKIPKIQVTPSNGKRIQAAFTKELEITEAHLNSHTINNLFEHTVIII